MARVQFALDGSKINKIHQQLFMQKLIEFLYDIRTDKLLLWKIICGANYFDTDSNQFINIRKYTLNNHFLSQIHRWIDHVYN